MRTDIQKLAKQVARKGRKGDTTLVHMNKPEVKALRQLGATTNPDTGLPEAFSLGGVISSIGKGIGSAVKGVVSPSNIIGNLAGLGGTGITGSTIGGNVLRGKDKTDNVNNAAQADIMGGAAFGLGPALGGTGTPAAGGSSSGFAMPAAQPLTEAELASMGMSQTAPGVWEATGAPAFAPTPAGDGSNMMGYGGAGDFVGGAGSAPSATPPMPPAIFDPGAIPPPPAGGAGAPGAPGASGGVVDNIIKGMKQNALALGLIGGATLMGAKQTPPPSGNAQIAGEASKVGKELINQYRSGQLSPSQQAAMAQMTQQAKNQVNQYFASINQSDSTSHMQALAQIDQQALAMQNNILQTALSQGLQSLGIATGPLNTMAQYQLGQDQNLSKAFGNFASAVGNIFGRQSGKTA